MKKIQDLTEEEVEKEFDVLVDKLDGTKYRDWVWTWLDIDHITNVTNYWDIETRRDCLDELRELTARNSGIYLLDNFLLDCEHFNNSQREALVEAATKIFKEVKE